MEELINEDLNRHVIILVGHRCSGRTEAVRAMQDLGVVGVDNLPPQLLSELARIRYEECPPGRRHACAVALDLSDEVGVRHALDSLKELDKMAVPYRVLALESREATSLQRITEKCNLPADSLQAVTEDLLKEKLALQPLHCLAVETLDTSQLSVYDLRERLGLLIKGASIHRNINIDIHSFGFKYGPFLPADILFDVRFIANPYYIPALRELNGKDEACAEYVLAQPHTQFFIQHLTELVTTIAPSYSRLGKARLRMGLGCTGGQHRSVAVAERVAHEIRLHGFHVSVHHREMGDSNGRSA